MHLPFRRCNLPSNASSLMRGNLNGARSSGDDTRPGEILTLQWQHILLNKHGGLIRIADGKSKAAKRVLPMTPNVYAVLLKRFEDATLARIAGYSSIVIAMRYVHPQADAIERAFAMAHGKIKPRRLRGQTKVKEAGVGTKVDTLEKSTEKLSFSPRSKNQLEHA